MKRELGYASLEGISVIFRSWWIIYSLCGCGLSVHGLSSYLNVSDFYIICLTEQERKKEGEGGRDFEERSRTNPGAD